MDPHEIRRLATFEMQHGDIDEDEFREMEAREADGKKDTGGGKSGYVRAVVRDPLRGSLSTPYRLAR